MKINEKERKIVKFIFSNLAIRSLEVAIQIEILITWKFKGESLLFLLLRDFLKIFICFSINKTTVFKDKKRFKFGEND